MASPTSEIRVRSGMKGKAVHIIHVYKDFLWAMGDKSDPPQVVDISGDGDEEYTDDEEEHDNSNKENQSQNQSSTATIAPDDLSNPHKANDNKEEKPKLSTQGNYMFLYTIDQNAGRWKNNGKGN